MPPQIQVEVNLDLSTAISGRLIKGIEHGTSHVRRTLRCHADVDVLRALNITVNSGDVALITIIIIIRANNLYIVEIILY